MELQNTSTQKIKRPIIITIICFYLLLMVLMTAISLINVMTTKKFGISAKEILGESKYYSSIAILLVSVALLSLVIIGLWRMKKRAAYFLVGYFLVSLILVLFQNTLQLRGSDQGTYSAAAIFFQIINLASCFFAMYYVVINNLKKESSFILQKQLGIIASIIGVILLFVSQTADFTQSQTTTWDNYDLNKRMGLPDVFNNHMLDSETRTYIDTTKKNLVLFSGLAILVGGCIFFVLSLNNSAIGATPSKQFSVNAQTTPSGNETMIQIERLNDLRQKGILTEEEFANKKSELLKKI